MLAHLSISADSQTSYQPPNRVGLSRRFPPFFGWIFFIAVSASFVILGLAPSTAAEFRVETSVYVGKQIKPREQRVTVFTNNKVVDFSLGEPNEIYVLDTVLNELTIVDEGNRTTSKVAANELGQFVMNQQARIAKMHAALRNRLMPFLKVTWDEGNETLKLAGQDFSYIAKVRLAAGVQVDDDEVDDDEMVREIDAEIREETVNAEMVLAYRKFTDCIARYNAMRPQAMPPQTRLKLNAEIAKINAVPREIVKTVLSGTARSTHRFSSLGNEDRVRTREILKSIPEFQSLELSDFLIR